jgi:hypothetical protein
MSRRIWQITKATAGVTEIHSLRFVMRVFIESGSIYIFVTMSYFFFWLTPYAYAISLVAVMVSIYQLATYFQVRIIIIELEYSNNRDCV